MKDIILVGNLGREPQKKNAPIDVSNRGETSIEALFNKKLNDRFPEAANDAGFPASKHLLTLYAKVARSGYAVAREEYGPPGVLWFRVRRSDGVVCIHTLEHLEALGERCEKSSAERILRNLHAEVLS